eukprot:680074-Prymnesium_polylepis.1
MAVLEGQIQMINHVQKVKYDRAPAAVPPAEAKLWPGPLHWTHVQAAARGRHDVIAARVAEVVRAESVCKNPYWEMLKGLLDLEPRMSRAAAPIRPEQVRMQALELHLPMGLAAQNHLLWIAIAYAARDRT